MGVKYEGLWIFYNGSTALFGPPIDVVFADFLKLS